MRIFCVLFMLAIAVFTSVESFAQPRPVVAKIDEMTVTCNNLSRDLETGFTTLEGAVHITYREQFFSADKVIIDQKNQTAQLLGNVSVKSDIHEIGGDSVFLDYFNNQAEITNGYIKSNNIYFVGSSIKQNSENNFTIQNAEFTTCANCPPAWSFDGTNIEAEMGGYAFLKNSFLKIYGVPVFWLPYLIVPLKNERQTGLLAPEIGYIRDRRLVFSQSLFVAISRSQDMTFTLKNHEIGGLKKELEYRYVLNENSFGEFNLSHMNDSLFQSKKRYTHFLNDPNTSSFQRWSLKGYNEYSLDSANSKNLALNLNLVSDVLYPHDFSDEYPYYSDTGLENRLTYNQVSNNTLLNINAIYYKHLLTANALSDNSMAVHKLPEINYVSTIKPIGESKNLFYKFNANYANFYRKSKYDDMSLAGDLRYVSNDQNDPSCENKLSGQCLLIEDGSFDENIDLIRTGQRFNYKASLLTKGHNLFDTFTLTPELSYNENHYLFPVGDDKYAAKKYVQLDVISRAKFFKIFEDHPTKKYKHEFIPEVSYKWIPWDYEDQHPFFGLDQNNQTPALSKVVIGDDDLKNKNSVQFDYNDRIYDRHLISLTLLNRVIKKENSDYTHLFDFQLKQSYDLYQAYHGLNRNEPLSDLSGIMNLYLNEFTFSNQTNYYPYQSATNSSTALTYKNDLGQYFKVGYISKQTGGPQQDDVSLSLGFTSTYLNILMGSIFDTRSDREESSRLKKTSFIAQIKPPGDCLAVNFYHEQKVGLEAEWKIRLDFSFDGKPTKVIPPRELNIHESL